MMISRSERTVNYALLGLFAVIALWPVATILVGALGPDDAGVTGGGLANLAAAWEQGRFGQAMLVSAAVSSTVVLVAGGLSILAGYAFAVLPVPGGRLLYPLLLLGLTVQHTSGFTLLAAGALIVAAPVVVVYLFLQRHFVRGMLEGAIRE